MGTKEHSFNKVFLRKNSVIACMSQSAGSSIMDYRGCSTSRHPYPLKPHLLSDKQGPFLIPHPFISLANWFPMFPSGVFLFIFSKCLFQSTNRRLGSQSFRVVRIKYKRCLSGLKPFNLRSTLERKNTGHAGVSPFLKPSLSISMDLWFSTSLIQLPGQEPIVKRVKTMRRDSFTQSSE